MMERDHSYFMEMALREAQAAFEETEVPIGAVVVRENRILGRGHNRTEALRDATAHAEMIAITSAAEKAGDWRLDDAVLYSDIFRAPKGDSFYRYSEILKAVEK